MPVWGYKESDMTERLNNNRMPVWASQVALVGKNPPARAGDMRLGFHPWVGKILWRRARQPTPVFLSGESHGQRSLAGYTLWCCKESDKLSE